MSDHPRPHPSDRPPSSRAAPGQIVWASASAQGSGRRNEDVCGCYPEFPEEGLFVVADGGSTYSWGGAGLAGLAVSALRAYFEGVYPDQAESGERRLERGMLAAHRCLRQVLELAYPFASAQIAALSVSREGVHLAHVGTCRIHRLRGRECALLTADHVAEGGAPTAVARTLDRADVSISLRTEERQSGDVYLLSTPGVHRALPLATLGEIIASSRGPEPAVKALIEEARKAGARQDASCIVLRVL